MDIDDADRLADRADELARLEPRSQRVLRSAEESVAAAHALARDSIPGGRSRLARALWRLTATQSGTDPEAAARTAARCWTVCANLLDHPDPADEQGPLVARIAYWLGVPKNRRKLNREHVDLRRRLVKIGPVVERDGTIRPYPKSPAGVRDVPVDDETWPRLRDATLATKPQGLLFTSPGGGGRSRSKRGEGSPLDYSNWYHRIWRRGLFEVVERGPRGGIKATRAVLENPQPTPHDLRHSYGTRLGEQGVPQHEIMALMGHESPNSVKRYLHAGPDRHDRARRAIAAARVARL